MGSREQDLIRRLVAPMAKEGLEVGPGDDAAIFPPLGDRRLVVSTDAAVEGVHFDFSFMSPFDVGYRALAAALSDLAAMGAVPFGYLLSMGLPKGLLEARLHELYQGLALAGEPWRLPLAGGDITASGELFLDVTVLGTLTGPALLRSAARPGDRLAVTGRPGLAALGLRLLASGQSGPEEARSAFLRPRPRFDVAALALAGGVAVGDDITDGVAAEVGSVCGASGVGAVLEPAAFPALPGLSASQAEALFLGGGDDLELLLAAPEAKLAALAPRVQKVGVPLTVIGEVTKGRGIFIRRRGRLEVLSEVGYDHMGEGP